MTTKTEGVVQTWECAKCKARYESPLRLTAVTCNGAEHKTKPQMKLIDGPEPTPPGGRKLPRPVPSTVVSKKWGEVPKGRPKVSKVSNPDLLLAALGIEKES